MIPDLNGAIYIGDGIYAKWISSIEFELMTSDGINITNRIVLDTYNFEYVKTFVNAKI